MRDIVDVIQQQARLPAPVRITDVGAMNIGRTESWQELIDRGLATLLGFEPQAKEGARCNAESGEGCRYLPEALGDGEIWPFYQCKFGPSSSIYEPNHDFVRQFTGLSDLMEVVQKSEVQTRRLDDIDEARHTDLLKLDIQGAEVILLENAKETLKHVSIVQTEACFVPLYKDQPLFAEIDQCLRAQGFMLHAILGLGRRALQPVLINNDPVASFNQALWSDIVYVKPFWDQQKTAPSSTLLKSAIVFDVVYKSYDFAARALLEFDRLEGTCMCNTYIGTLDERLAA